MIIIDESAKELTLSDERLERAIRETGAQMIILDPLQAYLGANVDMHRANEVRPIFKKLCSMAERTGTAVILIGHMNKAQGAKSSYRGLGSIDFHAAARSVLIIGRLKTDSNIRVVAHAKSSLAPEGKSIAFELGSDNSFHWRGTCDISVDELLTGYDTSETKTARMEAELREMLTDSVASEDVYTRAAALGISERTVKIAKKNLGVVSEKRADGWFWRLPESRV